VLPITDFGFLASGHARRLVDALTVVCAGLPARPTVRVSGGSALVDPDDRSVWAELTGSDEDLEALRVVAQAVVTGVEPLGFFCDRRQSKPRSALATNTEATTVEHLERVLEALSAYRSWPVDHCRGRRPATRLGRVASRSGRQLTQASPSSSARRTTARRLGSPSLVSTAET
jgi:hypothetical protein